MTNHTDAQEDFNKYGSEKRHAGHSNALLWRLVTALVSILVLLAALEGFARIILRVSPVPDRFQLSHELGWEWTPGYQNTEVYHGVDYPMVISRQGLRNEIVAVPKPANTYRIIALGDSITEGPGVPLEQTFVKLLEEALRTATPQQQVEVINAGTGDYGTEQEYIWLRERGLAYDPDLVILEVYLNDSRSFTRPAAPVSILHNFFVRRSAFYYYYFNAVRNQRVAHEEAQPDFRFRFGQDWEAQAWKTDPEALTELIQAADQDWGLAWHDDDLNTIKDYLAQIVLLCHEHNIQLLLVLFPVDAQVYAEVDTPLGLHRPQQGLLAFAADQGVPALDLIPVLQTHGDRDLFYDQAHLKPETHRLVADTLLATLEQQRIGPQP